MKGLYFLKYFDKSQLWRFFVDGRFQKKYDGWVGYEKGERGSIQALLNGFTFMLQNYDLSRGLKATYLRELHKVCMLSVETTNLKSSPGDLRYLNAGIPFFAKTTTYEHLLEVFELRKNDGTAMFNSSKWGKTAEELDVDTIYNVIQKEGKINYRNWYPNLDIRQKEALQGKHTLHEFYEAKHTVQMMMASKMEKIVEHYNEAIAVAKSEEDKLKAICLVSREMELLHPFPDGNCRTFSCITLNHLLMYNGFPPTILENPNLDNEVSFLQWIEEVKKGMKRTETLIKNPTMKLFKYSILDMEEEKRSEFLHMAEKLIETIDTYKEIFLTPQKLQIYTKGEWITPVDNKLTFTGVGTYKTYKEGNIYFAMSIKDWIKEKKDVSKELSKIVKKGIRAVVLDDMDYFPHVQHLPVFFVKDAFIAFKQSATQVRKEHNPYTVLVTGTEGKTGAKVQFHHLLNRQAKTHAVLNSANIEIPVLRSLINLEVDDKIEINEVSVGSDEEYRVERTMMVNPNLCFFTNIGPNHMDMHKTLRNIMVAKSSVVEGLREDGVCIVNGSIEHYDMFLEEIYRRKPNAKIITYGVTQNNDAQLLSKRFDSKRFGYRVKARILDQELTYFVPMVQDHSPLASVGILLCIKYMGYDVEQAAKDYSDFVAYETMGRVLRFSKESGEVVFYDQSRRGGLKGMQSAFNDLKRFKPQGKIVALIGGISVKKDSDWTLESHNELARLINKSKIDKLYTTGKFMDYVVNRLNHKSIFQKHEDDIEELAKILYKNLQGGDMLFIIGSAYLYLGRVSEKLLQLKESDIQDENIESLNASKIDQAAYKTLLNFKKIEDGIEPSSVFKKRTDKLNYESFKSRFKNYLGFRSALLMHFFITIDKIFVNEAKFTCVNEDIKLTGNSGYVYNQDYCKRWFNNLDKNLKFPNKQLFGSFFYFGDSEYLLHFEAATLHFHIGFVKYSKKENYYCVEKMTLKELDSAYEILKRRYDFKENFNKRTWGLKWVSIDCGNFIDFSKAYNFNTIVNLKNSNLYMNTIKNLIQKMKKNI